MNAWLRIVLALVLACAVAPRARAQVATQSDQHAIEAYRRGDYESARTEWLAMLQGESAPRGPERARVLYDLGNVAFREGKALEAVGWYTSALRLRPRDADTWANSEQARATAKLEPADRGDLSAALTRLLTFLTRGESEWLVLAGLVVLGGALAMEAVRGGRLWRTLSIVAAALALLLACPWIGHVSRAGSDAAIVIEADKTLVKSEPRGGAAVISEVSAGSQVARLDELPDWAKIRLESGVEGWVAKSALFAIDR